MGVFDRLLGRAGAPAQTSVPPAATAPTPIPYLDGRSAAGLSAVWRCVTLIADAVADMPWTEWRGDDQLEASRLVRRPMVTMTRREWTWRVVATCALYNTSYWLHVGGKDAAGSPWSLLPLPPFAIQPLDVDPWGLLPPSRYQVAGQAVDAADLTVVRRAPWPMVSEDVAGILQIARRQFTAYLAADVAAARYWIAGGPTTTVITTEQELVDDDADDLAERWVARRTMGADYPAVLGKGAKAEPWGADPTAESAVEARREMVADVGRYFGVATRILNAPAGDSETYSNVEHDAVDLLRYTLRGYMGPVEDGVSSNLPGDYLAGRRMRLDPSGLVQGDLPSRAIAYPALVTAGIFTIPEARVRGFGLAPIPREPDPELADPAAESAPVTVTAQIR